MTRGEVRSIQAAVLSVFLAALLFGTSGTAQALGPESTTPMAVGTIRQFLGGLVLWLFLPSLGLRLGSVRTIWATRAGVIAALGSALYQVSFFGAVKSTGVATGTLATVASAPIFTGLISWALTRQRPRMVWVVATTICIMGLGVLSADRIQADADSLDGIVLALGAGLAIASYTVAAKRLLDRGMPALQVLSASYLLGGLILMPVMLAQPLTWLATASGLALAAYLGIVTMAAANLFYGRGLARLAPGPVTTLMLAEPIIATVLGILVLGESLAPTGVLGLLIVLVGLVMQGVALTRDERRPAASVSRL